MNLNEVAIFNCSEAEIHPSLPGSYLPRFPRPVRQAMSERGRFVSSEAIGVEVRFVTSSNQIRFHVQSASDAGEVLIYRGNFLVSTQTIEPGRVTGFFAETPATFKLVKSEMLSHGGFSPNVWRIFFSRYDLLFLGLETYGQGVRPPLPEELPAKTWLAYGSSITHSNPNGYPFVAARELGLDVLNKGLSGACHIEKETADHLATLKFDLATLELGVNMRGSFSPEEFKKRSSYLIKVLRDSHPKAPIALITAFPNFADYYPNPLPDLTNQLAYDDILREFVKTSLTDQLYLFEGKDILQNLSGLSQDLIHPTPFGHAHMGMNLANLLNLHLLR